MEWMKFYCRECWHLLKTMIQLMRGIWWLRKIDRPIVTIFGGAHARKSDTYFAMAHTIGYRLAKADIAVVTGGGAGIMAAANCGVSHALHDKSKIRSIGIRVYGLPEESNICAQKQLYVNQFWARKILMVQYAVSFAIFPGGFGTIDEFGEIMTLMKNKKMTGVPIVLLDKSYWAPFIAWLTDYALRDGLIAKNDLALISVTDDVDEAIAILESQCAACKI